MIKDIWREIFNQLSGDRSVLILREVCKTFRGWITDDDIFYVWNRWAPTIDGRNGLLDEAKSIGENTLYLRPVGENNVYRVLVNVSKKRSLRRVSHGCRSPLGMCEVVQVFRVPAREPTPVIDHRGLVTKVYSYYLNRHKHAGDDPDQLAQLLDVCDPNDRSIQSDRKRIGDRVDSGAISIERLQFMKFMHNRCQVNRNIIKK